METTFADKMNRFLKEGPASKREGINLIIEATDKILKALKNEEVEDSALYSALPMLVAYMIYDFQKENKNESENKFLSLFDDTVISMLDLIKKASKND